MKKGRIRLDAPLDRSAVSQAYAAPSAAFFFSA